MPWPTKHRWRKERRRRGKERLEARISAEQKDLFVRAAELQGRTLTDFVIASVHEAAVRTIGDMQCIQLTAQESRALAEAMLNPREPTDRLRSAGAPVHRNPRELTSYLAYRYPERRP